MAPFEEKVLAYLDGSLPPAEREEVMRAVLISPDRRALLDAHLRMNDLFTIVQKPISAPLSVQRDLAKEIPVLAAKLPYLAADNRRRSAAAFGFWGRLSSGLGSSRASTIGAVLLAIGLVSAGVWFTVNQSQRNNNVPTLSHEGAVASNGTPSVGAPTAAASNTGSGLAGNGGASSVGGGGSGNGGGSNDAPHGYSSSVGGGSGSGSHGMLVADTVSGAAGHHVQHHGTDLPDHAHKSQPTALDLMNGAHDGSNRAFNQPAARRHDLNNRALTDNSIARVSSMDIPARDVAKDARTTNAVSDAMPAKDDVASPTTSNAALKDIAATESNSSKDFASQSTSTAKHDSKSIASTPPPDASPAKPLEEIPADISTITSLRPPSSLGVSRINQINYSLQEDEKSYFPVRVFAVYGPRFISSNRSTQLSTYAISHPNVNAVTTATPTVLSSELGADYEINPWVSAGLRVGYTNFLQIQSLARPDEKIPGYDFLTRKYSDAQIASVPAPWLGLALSYVVNPQSDGIRFGANAAGGFGFITGVSASPIVMVEANAGYELSNAFELRAAISYDASWVKEISPVVAATSTTLGVIQQGPDRGTLQSNAVGVSVGLVFHP